MTQHNLSIHYFLPNPPVRNGGSHHSALKTALSPPKAIPTMATTIRSSIRVKPFSSCLKQLAMFPPKRKRPRRRGGAFCGSSFQSHFRRLARVGDADGRPERASELCRVAKIVGGW